MARKIQAKKRARAPEDEFEAVAKRLECDPDEAAFKKRLEKIAKPTKSGKSK